MRGALFTALLATTLAGCDSSVDHGYDPTVIYPMRTDVIVEELSRVAPPTDKFPAGQLNESLALHGKKRGTVIDPLALPTEDRLAVDRALVKLFGSPAAARIETPSGQALGLTAEMLAVGSRVFKQRCIDCHGMAGDGRGPTSLWTYPHARDFRSASYKFVSAAGGQGLPTRADIESHIRRGIGGNSMPAFDLLPDDQIRAVTSYVIHLSVRGSVEIELLKAQAHSDGSTPNWDEDAIHARDKLLSAWVVADHSRLDPTATTPPPPQTAADNPNYADIVRRGHALFTTAVGGCASCHVDYGRAAAWRFDIWGVPVKPPDLTSQKPRGGDDPIALYRRIRCGIVPSQMPPQTALAENQVWDIVAFLRALPVPEHLPGDVRMIVYPGVN